MSIKIETYRGHDILFEPESERFTYCIDTGDWRTKQSYTACKKSIDEYIKDNANFKPFELESTTFPWEKITVTGKRKDDLFTYENNGNKKIISKYDEDRWMIPNIQNDAPKTEIRRLRKELEILRNLIGREEEKIIQVTLKKYKEQL